MILKQSKAGRPDRADSAGVYANAIGGATTTKRNFLDRSGATAVEFAAIAPVFLLMLVGMICYGLYFSTSHGVAQLAADAARASIAGLSDAERAEISKSHIRNRASDYMMVNPDKLTVQAGPTADDATQFKITVRYDASALPIWVFKGLIPLPNQTIVKVASIKRGGF